MRRIREDDGGEEGGGGVVGTCLRGVTRGPGEE